MGCCGRNAFYEWVLKIAPFLLGYLFIVVAIALAMNFMDSRRHPEATDKYFDPVKNFSKISSAGMVNVLTKNTQAPGVSQKKRCLIKRFSQESVS